jgi:HEAT repeat protein
MEEATSVPDERLEKLIAVINDPHVSVRGSAVVAIGTIGPAASDAVPHLVAALGDESRDVRKEAAKALGLIGTTASAAVLALRKSLHDDSRLVRRESAKTLGLIGIVAAAALPELIATLNDSESEVQTESAKAIGMMGSVAANAIPTLIQQLRFNRMWSVRRDCARALGLIGRRSSEVILALDRAKWDADPNVSDEAAKSWKKLTALVDGLKVGGITESIMASVPELSVQQAEIADLARTIGETIDAEISDLTTTDKAHIFGDNGFWIRTLIHKIATKAIEQHLAKKPNGYQGVSVTCPHCGQAAEFQSHRMNCDMAMP